MQTFLEYSSPFFFWWWEGTKEKRLPSIWRSELTNLLSVLSVRKVFFFSPWKKMKQLWNILSDRLYCLQNPFRAVPTETSRDERKDWMTGSMDGERVLGCWGKWKPFRAMKKPCSLQTSRLTVVPILQNGPSTKKNVPAVGEGQRLSGRASPLCAGDPGRLHLKKKHEVWCERLLPETLETCCLSE